MYINNTSGGIGFQLYNQQSGYGIYVRNVSGSRFDALRVDNWSTSANGIVFQDNASAVGQLLNIQHNGSGYGINILNNTGAASSIAVHQYSESPISGAAFTYPVLWLDNCTSGTTIHIDNTENQTNAPGLWGKGKFMQCRGISAMSSSLEMMFYIDCSGSIWTVPKTAAPSTPTDGLMWIDNSGGTMALRVSLSGTVRTVNVT